MSARADEGAQRDAVMRRGMAALRAHLRDHPPAPAGDAAPYAAVLAELVEQYVPEPFEQRGDAVAEQNAVLDDHDTKRSD